MDIAGRPGAGLMILTGGPFPEAGEGRKPWLGHVVLSRRAGPKEAGWARASDLKLPSGAWPVEGRGSRRSGERAWLLLALERAVDGLARAKVPKPPRLHRGGFTDCCSLFFLAFC